MIGYTEVVLNFYTEARRILRPQLFGVCSAVLVEPEDPASKGGTFTTYKKGRARRSQFKIQSGCLSEPVLGANLKVALRVVADRAYIRSLGAHYHVTAVAALPDLDA